MKESKKKIVFFISNLDFGGAEQQCLYLIEGLKNYFDITLVYIEDGVKSKDFKDTGVDLIKIKSNSAEKFISHIFQLNKILYDLKPIIVYSWLQKANILTFICKTLLYPKKNFKHFTSVRFGHIPLKKSFKNKIGLFILKLSYKYSDLVISNSEQGKKTIIKFFNIKKNKIYILRNIIKIPFLKERAILNNKKTFSIGWIGRLNKHKRPDLAIDAVALMNKKINIVLNFFGEEQGIKKNHLKNYAKNKDVIVKFRGFYKDKIKMYSSVDLLLSTSDTIEGSSNVALEALACGLPVVLTDVGDNDFFCKKGRGEVAPINNPMKISDCIARALESNTI